MIGETVSRYRILAKLGGGAMGVVYEAEDPELGRLVAIKFLPEGTAPDPDALERFRREARAASALNHPGICTVFDVGEHDGQPYIVMERLQGRSLGGAIGPRGMPIDQVIALGAQIADALDAAHRAGIVHRDLKPSNLFLTARGEAKVLDFGLAKIGAAEASGRPAPDATTEAGEHLTLAGTVLGTVAYMSPEQARGQAVDERSDLYSLGVVLYEMATGRRPFEGESVADLFAAVLRNEPEPPSRWNPDIPARLEGVILRALAKSPSARYRTAAELRRDLLQLRRDGSRSTLEGTGVPSGGGRLSVPKTEDSPRRRVGVWLGVAAAVVVVAATIGYFRAGGRGAPPGAEGAGRPKSASAATVAFAPTGGPSARSIAVLPFVNLSSDKEQEYFSDGIAEDLLNLLTKVPGLRVTARTSSFSFKGKDVAIPEIARQLHVAHVLEGSVQKAGGQVRIAARLVDAATDAEIWSRSWDRRLDDVFAIQDEIAADVVRQLKLTLLDAVPKSRTTDPRSYALYLQAVQLGRQHTPDAIAKSSALLHRALAIDPRYAPAWSELASDFVHEANTGVLSNQEGYARAREAVARALAIDPDYAPGHAQLGYIAMGAGKDLAEAARHLQRALEIDPGDLDVLRNAAVLLANLGRLDGALAIEEAIVRRDPMNVTARFNLGITQLGAARLDEAVESFRTVLSLSPGRGGAHYNLGVALLREGDAAGALAEIEQETSDPWRLFGLPMAYHALGNRADSDAALSALIAKYGRDAAYNIAYVYAFRGEADRAFEWLGRAVELRDSGLGEIVTERLFDPVRSDPRWLPFLRRLDKAPDQLARIEFRVPVPD